MVTLYVEKPENVKKLEGNNAREGYSIIQPSQEEIDNATMDIKDNIIKFINTNLK
jgi:hypothetical protein